MRTFFKHCTYLLLSIFLFTSTGCLGDIKNPIPEEDAFKLETFRWESIPQNIQDQISGAGCTFFANNNDQDILLTNGLVKINGIFEIIEYKSSNDDFTNDIYENDRWIIYGKMVSNPDGTLTGTLKLRSKSKDGSTIVSANKICGS